MNSDKKRARIYRVFRFLGIWATAGFAWVVSTGYFLFMPRRVGMSLRFYRLLFPQRNRWYYLGCVWKQFHNFAALFSERLALENGRELEIDSEGFEHLQEAADQGTGGVIIMSHVGNWELAARLLRKRNLKILLFMGARTEENVEKLQKIELQTNQVEVVATEKNQDSPLAGLEGLSFIRQGGFISMAGDRMGRPNQASVTVRFLGDEFRFPQAPYVFAALTHTPLFVFFAMRTGRRKYSIRIISPKIISATSRAERRRAIQDAAQEYASHLEEAVRQFPFQWYHFLDSNIHQTLKRRKAVIGKKIN